MKVPNLAYRFALWLGNVIRTSYRLALPMVARQPVRSPRELDLDVFAYSSEAMLPEQIASIRSFLRNAGKPRRFVIVSDGSHSKRSIDLLRTVDATVEVRGADTVAATLPPRLREYLADHPTGKQLALIMSLPQARAALYVDADVRFFPGANELARQIERPDAPAYYLPDCQFAGDRRLIRDPAEEADPVNTGVLLVFRKLDWSLAIDRFLEMDGPANFHTNQTMTHLTMHRNGARPLDPARYVLRLDDQTVMQDRYASLRLVLRHYVNPVRHKFWTSLTQ